MHSVVDRDKGFAGVLAERAEAVRSPVALRILLGQAIDSPQDAVVAADHSQAAVLEDRVAQMHRSLISEQAALWILAFGLRKGLENVK